MKKSLLMLAKPLMAKQAGTYLTPIKYILFFSFLISLTGCFDVRREIKFYPNGGGEEKIYVTLDKDFYDALSVYASQDQSGKAKGIADTVMDNEKLQPRLNSEILKTGGTSLRDCIITDKPDGSKEVYIYYIFDEPSCIVKIVNSATNWFATNPEVVYSQVKFTDESGVIKFKEYIRNASRAFNDELANNVFQNLMTSRFVHQSIEFAFDVTSSNTKSQVEKTCTWDYPISDAMFNNVELTTEMNKPEGIDLPYAEKIEKIEKVDKNSNPLIRVMIYNSSREWVKTITGVLVNEDELVTSFKLMNLIEGAGYFSVRLNSDSLAGIDEMKENDLDQKMDLCFLRFNNDEKVKPLKYAALAVTTGEKIKIFYHPNSLSSTVYIMDGTITGTKKMSGNTIYEVKPLKPLTLEGGAIFNENGEFLGMISPAYSGEVGKLYVIPALYIKSRIPK